MNQATCLPKLPDNFGRLMVYVDRLGEIITSLISKIIAVVGSG